MATSPLQRKIKTFNNPILSIWQHAIHKVISQKVPNQDLSSTQPEMTQFVAAAEALTTGQAMPRVDSSGSVIGDCAKLAAEYVWAEITLNTLKASEIEDELRYGTCGPPATHKLVIVT